MRLAYTKEVALGKVEYGLWPKIPKHAAIPRASPSSLPHFCLEVGVERGQYRLLPGEVFGAHARLFASLVRHHVCDLGSLLILQALERTCTLRPSGNDLAFSTRIAKATLQYPISSFSCRAWFD